MLRHPCTKPVASQTPSPKVKAPIDFQYLHGVTVPNHQVYMDLGMLPQGVSATPAALLLLPGIPRIRFEEGLGFRETWSDDHNIYQGSGLEL